MHPCAKILHFILNKYRDYYFFRDSRPIAVKAMKGTWPQPDAAVST